MSLYKINLRLIKNLYPKFSYWEIFKITIAALLFRILDSYPNFKLDALNNIRVTINCLKKDLFSYKVPDGDEFNILNLRVFDLIPLEEGDTIIKQMYSLIRKYRAPLSYISSEMAKERIEKLDKEALGIGWYLIGSISCKKFKLSKYIDSIEISLIKISDSWAIISLNCSVNENLNLRLQNVLDENYYGFNLYSVPNLKKLNRMWPHTIYRPDLFCKNEIELCFKALYNDVDKIVLKQIGGLLSKNKMEVPKIHIFEYKRHVEENKTNESINRDLFWRLFDFELNTFRNIYSDGKDEISLIIPDQIKFSKFKGNILNILINKEKIAFEPMYVDLQNYINMLMREWITVVSPLLIMQAFIEETFYKISTFRKTFYGLLNKRPKKQMKIINKNFLVFRNLVHYFERLRNEVKFYDRSLSFPKLLSAKIKHSDKLVSYSEFISDMKNNTEYKYTRAAEIIDFMKKNIEEYFDFHIASGNLSIQKRIAILTLITVVIGTLGLLIMLATLIVNLFMMSEMP